MQELEVRGPFITLGQLLKLRDVVGSGGEARSYLETSRVLVNGQIESRRGRKLYPGDIVEIEGESVALR